MTTPRPHHRLRLGRLFGMAALALSAALPAQALDLRLPPSAIPSATRSETLSSYNVPTGPWRAGVIPTTTAEGAIDQTAWKIAAPGQTTLQLLQPLRDQIAQAGYTTVFECDTAACGGFDFRYGTDILPEPQMHVDLGDFRFLAARRDGSDGADWLTLIISRSADTGFVQLTRIGTPAPDAADLTVSSKSPFSPAPALAAAPTEPAALAQDDPLAAALTAGDHAILTDLQFPSGKSTLAPGDYPSLAALADWLSANPQSQVELVGHTDASGNAQANIALSLARAEATRDALVTLHGIDPTRIATRGAGPTDPIASNDTPEGRAQNRRVEVIATPTL